MRAEPSILTRTPAEEYAGAYLRGDTAATDKLSADLGIPPSSWFWHALVLGAVTLATRTNDTEFRRLIPKLLHLIDGKPGFRDEALELILERYHACNSTLQDERLRDYVCHPTVWKNPKLKALGIATAWNRVPDPVWLMVLRWVNERNLKAFFDILAARNNADEGRLNFWSKYLDQISWTRLVFSADTMALKRTNEMVRELIANEEGAYAELTVKRDVDAFMMQIGSYLIVEFSKKPNACYIYKLDKLPFEAYSRRSYHGGTEDLGAGFRKGCAARIVHREHWEYEAARQLEKLGIHADVPMVQNAMPFRAATKPTAPKRPIRPLKRESPAVKGPPNLAVLRAQVAIYSEAWVQDQRGPVGGGRLWVNDPLQRAELANKLATMGFKWSSSKQAWYFPES